MQYNILAVLMLTSILKIKTNIILIKLNTSKIYHESLYLLEFCFEENVIIIDYDNLKIY
jgi:hypothetical protein